MLARGDETANGMDDAKALAESANKIRSALSLDFKRIKPKHGGLGFIDSFSVIKEW
jgi:hypothetical protein